MALEDITTQIAGIVATILIILLSIGVLSIVAFFAVRAKRYNTPVDIVEIDSTGNKIFKTDKGGIFFDHKTKMRLFFLLKHKVGLKPDNIPFVKTPKGHKVFLYQHSFKNFSYITPQINNPDFSFSMGDEDISWGLMAYERGKIRFMNSLLGQILPFIPFIIMVFGLIIILVLVFKNINPILDKMDSITTSLARANLGTSIVGG